MVMAGDEEGGLEKHVIEMANGLVQLGHRVSLIAHAKYADRVVNVNFIPLDLTKSRNNPFILWQLYQAIKKTRADILHAQANKAVAMIAPLLSWLKIPSVATLHNLKKNTQAFNKFDRIIAVSQRVANQFHSQEKIRVVLNGVQPPVHTKQSIGNSPLQAIAIGRLVEAKGFDLLVEAWKGIEANLWIVGDGPDESTLVNKIKELKLDNQIELLGHRNDINELLQQADVMVISSRNEGGPYTLAEALLQHRPVISTDVGMVAQVLPDTMICPVKDVKALHDLISCHFSNFENLQIESEKIYKLAEQQLTIEAMIKNTVQFYQELIHA